MFRSAPQELRRRRRRADRLVADGGLTLRLPVTGPYDWDAVLGFLTGQAIPGVEAVDADVYRRTIVLDGGPGLLEVRPGGGDQLLLRAHLPYWEGLIHVVERVRRLLALDVDLDSAAHLRADPLLGPLIGARPGLRIPGAWTPFDAGVRAIVRRHCGPADAAAHLGRLVRDHGPAISGLAHGLTHAFPGAEAVAAADLETSGLPPETAGTVRRFARAVAAGDLRLDGAADLDALVAVVTAVPGIDRVAAHHMALWLGERDAFPAEDPILRRALRALDPRAHDAAAVAEAWRPRRSLAAAHLLAATG